MDGIVDRQFGAQLVVVRTLANDAVKRERDYDQGFVADAQIQLCGQASGECVTAIWDGERSYVLAAADLPLEEVVEVRIAIGASEITSTGRLPRETGVRYDSLSTTFIPPRSSVFGPQYDAYLHRFSVVPAAADHITILDIGRVEGQYSRTLDVSGGAGAGCQSVNLERYVVLVGACGGGQAPVFSAYQNTDDEPVMTLRVSSSFDLEFPNFLEALQQDNTASYFAGLFDVIEITSNVRGAGGFVLFSATDTYRVRLR